MVSPPRPAPGRRLRHSAPGPRERRRGLRFGGPCCGGEPRRRAHDGRDCCVGFWRPAGGSFCFGGTSARERRSGCFGGPPSAAVSRGAAPDHSPDAAARLKHLLLLLFLLRLPLLLPLALPFSSPSPGARLFEPLPLARFKNRDNACRSAVATGACCRCSRRRAGVVGGISTGGPSQDQESEE